MSATYMNPSGNPGSREDNQPRPFTTITAAHNHGVGLMYALGNSGGAAWQAGWDMANDPPPAVNDGQGGYYLGAAWGIPRETPRNLMSVRESVVLNPSGTISTTEQIRPENYQGTGGWADVWSSDTQFTGFGSAGTWYDMNNSAQHHGKDSFNYMFVDGHVEFLDRFKTNGQGKPGDGKGMWSVTTADD